MDDIKIAIVVEAAGQGRGKAFSGIWDFMKNDLGFWDFHVVWDPGGLKMG